MLVAIVDCLVPCELQELIKGLERDSIRCLDSAVESIDSLHDYIEAHVSECIVIYGKNGVILPFDDTARLWLCCGPNKSHDLVHAPRLGTVTEEDIDRRARAIRRLTMRLLVSSKLRPFSPTWSPRSASKISTSATRPPTFYSPDCASYQRNNCLVHFGRYPDRWGKVRAQQKKYCLIYNKPMVHSVFLYGALHTEKLISIVGEVVVLGGCILKNYKVTFGGSQKVFQGSSVATVTPNDETDVIGILYEISERQAALLDLFMGSRTGSMKKTRVSVVDGHKDRAAIMYVLSKDTGEQVRPNTAYEKLHEKLVREAYALYRKQQQQT